MEIKKGFKKTDIGIIPYEWEVDTFNEIADKDVRWSITGGPFGSNLKTSDYTSEGIRIIQLQNIGDGVFNNDYKIYTSKSKADQLLSCNIYPTEIILSKMGDPVARACFIPNEDIRYLMASDGIRLVVDENKYDKKFVHDYLNSRYFRDLAISASTGSTRQRIGLQELKKLKVARPPLEEQTAIAQVLSDIDGLISSLEKLIEKKKLIKQGTMIELMQPKNHWAIKTLADVANYRRGTFPQPYGLDKWYDDNSGFPFVQVFDVNDDMKLKEETKRQISIEAQKLSLFVKKGSIILTIQGSIGRIAMTQYDCYMDRTLLLFESFKVPFNQYFFMISVFLLFEKEKQNAPGGTIKTITKQALSSFPISYPSLDEQNRIAEILSDMDSEIESLEQKLDKYKAVKQGMMQNLLTGKIRLV